jgi:FkbM family methyltransferase
MNLDHYSDYFINFYTYLLLNRKKSKSQLFQDLFVLFNFNEKRNGTFLEFGATDGLSLSNTYLLENSYEWKGVLAEPSPQWYESLNKNRPNCKIINDCIYSESGKSLDFFVSNSGVLSTIEEYRDSDLKSMPGNSKIRNSGGYSTKVLSISLNDVFIKYFNSSPIDYMSVDTEGSEFEILNNFDFKKFGPSILTVEHNQSDQEQKIDELLVKNGYLRYFKEHTQFDAWYILQL